MSERSPRDSKQKETRRRRRRAWAVCLLVTLGAMLLWSVVSYAVSVKLRVYSIPTASMAPTIRAGDKVGVEIDRRTQPGRGEVWVFLMPPSGGTGGTEAVKRVVGLPGDTVEVAGGKLIVNGLPVAEPYLPGPMTYTLPRRKLGPDEYFVLGDSRNGSHDSHVWGPLSADRLIGRVKVRYWPPHRIGGL
jgi:signal peptidase I